MVELACTVLCRQTYVVRWRQSLMAVAPLYRSAVADPDIEAGVSQDES